MLGIAKRQYESSVFVRHGLKNKVECFCKIQLKQGEAYWIRQKSSLKVKRGQLPSLCETARQPQLSVLTINILTSWPSFIEEEEEYERRTGPLVGLARLPLAKHMWKLSPNCSLFLSDPLPPTPNFPSPSCCYILQCLLQCVSYLTMFVTLCVLYQYSYHIFYVYIKNPINLIHCM